MKSRQLGILLLLSACTLLHACDTDRYANQPTVTITESEDPELRKALILKLNAASFDYEITRDGDIRYPRSNQAEFEAILHQLTHEQTGIKPQ